MPKTSILKLIKIYSLYQPIKILKSLINLGIINKILINFKNEVQYNFKYKNSYQQQLDY